MNIELSPSAILIGALLAGFVLYLAKNNRLSVYWGLLFGSASSSSTSGGIDWSNPVGVGQQLGTATRQWICRQTGYMCSGTGTGTTSGSGSGAGP